MFCLFLWGRVDGLLLVVFVVCCCLFVVLGFFLGGGLRKRKVFLLLISLFYCLFGALSLSPLPIPGFSNLSAKHFNGYNIFNDLGQY